MNSRSLSPFFISLALLGSLVLGSRSVLAQSGSLLSLSAQRSSAVDASGSTVDVHCTTPALPAAAPAAPAAAAPLPEKTVCTLTREAAIASLQRQLVEHYNLEGDLQLDLGRSWNDPAPSPHPLSITIIDYPSQASSTMPLRLKYESNGEYVSEISLIIRAQLWRDAWSTRKPVAREEVFDTSSLELRRVDILRERDAVLSNVGDRNYSFTRSVPSGRLLNWRDIAPRSLVHKGEFVEVAAVDGPILVSMKALALQNGAAGETISVRNLDSKKEISAQVVGDKRVIVRF
jgi:flagella basal body P-ring formation protein FlgA